MELKREAENVSEPRFSMLSTPPTHSVINDQSLILFNFEVLFLLSPSEIRRELCKLMITISQVIDRYNVPVVGKDGKLNDSIERSALWSSKRNLWSRFEVTYRHA